MILLDAGWKLFGDTDGIMQLFKNPDVFFSSMVIACHSLFSVYWCYTIGDDVGNPENLRMEQE